MSEYTYRRPGYMDDGWESRNEAVRLRKLASLVEQGAVLPRYRRVLRDLHAIITGSQADKDVSDETILQELELYSALPAASTIGPVTPRLPVVPEDLTLRSDEDAPQVQS